MTGPAHHSLVTKGKKGVENRRKQSSFLVPVEFETQLTPIIELCRTPYWGLGGRLLAAETREPHSSNSLLVSSL